MSVADVVGWVAAIVGAGYALPQLIRTARMRTSAGLSRLGWQLQCAVCLGWIGYGLIHAMPNQIVCNLVIIVASLGIVAMMVRDRRLSMVATLVPVVVVGLALVGVDVWLGAAAFGLVIVVPQTSTLVAQLRDLVVSPDVRGVSLGFLVLGIVIQALWLTWSLLVADHAVLIAAVATIALLAANCAVWLFRHGHTGGGGRAWLAGRWFAGLGRGTTLAP